MSKINQTRDHTVKSYQKHHKSLNNLTLPTLLFFHRENTFMKKKLPLKTLIFERKYLNFAALVSFVKT